MSSSGNNHNTEDIQRRKMTNNRRTQKKTGTATQENKAEDRQGRTQQEVVKGSNYPSWCQEVGDVYDSLLTFVMKD